MSILDKAKQFAELTLEKRKLEAQALELGRQLSDLSQEIIELNEEAGLERIPLEGLGTISFKNEVSATIKDDKALFDWLAENDMMDIAKYSVHHKTLGSLCKERLQEGEEPPSGVKVNHFTRCSLVKG